MVWEAKAESHTDIYNPNSKWSSTEFGFCTNNIEQVNDEYSNNIIKKILQKGVIAIWGLNLNQDTDISQDR